MEVNSISILPSETFFRLFRFDWSGSNRRTPLFSQACRWRRNQYSEPISANPLGVLRRWWS